MSTFTLNLSICSTYLFLEIWSEFHTWKVFSPLKDYKNSYVYVLVHLWVLREWAFICKIVDLDKVIMLLFSRSVVSNSLWPDGLRHARLPCPSPSPGVCSKSFPLSRWCHPTILSSVVPFCLQSFPASGSLLISQLFKSGGQSIGPSTSASVFQWIFRVDFL